MEALNRGRDGIAGTALTEADTGGPLEQGDIEDIGGSTYVICPWHRYVISVEDGNSIYYDMQKNVKSKGIRQRTHRVKVSLAHSHAFTHARPSAYTLALSLSPSPTQNHLRSVLLRLLTLTLASPDHSTQEENGEVFVQLTKLPGGEDEIPSDHYCPATDEEKRRMGLMPKSALASLS